MFFFGLAVLYLRMCRNVREIERGECHVCLLEGELFVGKLLPGAWGDFEHRNWQKICLNCYPHLENFPGVRFPGYCLMFMKSIYVQKKEY